MPSPGRVALAVLASLSVVLSLAACGGPSPAARAALDRISAAGLLHDTEALGADSMAGRGPGTAGDRMARAYLARRLQEIGFEPGGPDGAWEQPITLVGLTVKGFDEWRFTGPGGKLALRWRTDFIGGAGVQEPRVAVPAAEVVFVGYGIQAPEFEWDDFKGAGLAGKILLFLNSDPDWDSTLFAGPTRLFYGRWDYKYEAAARQGAAGAILLHTEESAGYGWNVVDRSWSGTQFEPPAAGEARVRLKSWATEPAVRRLCALGGHDLDTLIAAARRRDFRPVPLGVTTAFAFDVGRDTIATANVVGVLPGSDPRRREEYVVYSTHHDHLGVGEPDSTGDRIYNGAADNATGCAQVLALAEAFAGMQPRPKRSVMAVFVAGEEQGLVGSRYFVAHPTVPLARLAANINFDGGNTLGRTADVAVIGMGKSDLEDRLVTAARTQGRRVVPEPEPDKGYYYRSDQLSFARGGVPALYFRSGQSFLGRPEGWGKEREAEFRRRHYHQPSDQVRPDWDLSGMVEDTRLGFLVGLDVAQGAPLPAWRPGDEFEAVRKQSLEQAAAGGR